MSPVTKLVTVVLLAQFGVPASADIAISMGEQKARPYEADASGRFKRFLFDQGTGGPGHSTLYVSDLCLDGSFFKVRMCRPEDKDPGVYLSFIDGLSDHHSWIAVSRNLYLYGTIDPADRPIFSTTFNSQLFQKRDDTRPIEIKTTFFKDDQLSVRNSVLDAVRTAYFGNPNSPLGIKDGDANRADKVNIFVTAERDVYNITLHGDTRKEAEALLVRLNSRENSSLKVQGKKVEGKYGWWANCTFKVNDWMVHMFGKEIGVSPSLWELRLENPRHYAKQVLIRLAKMRAAGTLKFPVSIQYIPKIASDRKESYGFGSPAQNLYDPRSIGGFFMWYGPAPVAGVMLLGNLQNFSRVQNRYKESPTLEIAAKTELLDTIKGTDKESVLQRAFLLNQIAQLREKWLGSSQEWAALGKRYQALVQQAKESPGIPPEMTYVLNAHGAPGALSREVTRIMMYRSHGSVSANGALEIHLALKQSSSGDDRSQDESLIRTTQLSERGMMTGDPALAALISLAAADSYLFGVKSENRPDVEAMTKELDHLEKVIARLKEFGESAGAK